MDILGKVYYFNKGEISPVNLGRYPYSDKKISSGNRSSSTATREILETEVRRTENIKVLKEESLDTIPLGDDKSLFDASFADDFMKMLNKDIRHETNDEALKRLIEGLRGYNENDRKVFSEYIVTAISKNIFENKYKDIVFNTNKNKDVFLFYIQNHMNRGIIFYSNGDYFEGEWKDEKKEGYGILIFKNLSKFEGNFKNNKQHGFGKLIQYDGETYMGEWKNGKICGYGTRYHSNGDKYVGQYLNNIRQGQGTYHFRNGDYYEGEWTEGKASRKGRFVYSNGDVYEGEFNDNQILGKGVFTYANGDCYKGSFINGLINGVGYYKNGKGDIYQGDFINGKRHGYGQYTGIDGSNHSGYWNNDVYVAKNYK